MLEREFWDVEGIGAEGTVWWLPVREGSAHQDALRRGDVFLLYDEIIKLFVKRKEEAENRMSEGVEQSEERRR